MRQYGVMMVLCGATLWGLSGTAAQQLFMHDGFAPAWLVTVRMLVSGLAMLLVIGLSKSRRSLFAVWKSGPDVVRLVVFATFGLAGVQYTYFAAIQTGNAATATFLQYLGPLLVIMYLLISTRKSPSKLQRVAIASALLGTFLLVTNGSFRAFHVSSASVAWGLLSAVALAFYTIQPATLIAKYGSATTVGWAMLIGGVCFAFIHPPWITAQQTWSLSALLLIVFIIVFGTFVAFYLYLSSLRYITPSETSLLACFEPLAAAVATVVLLHVRLGVGTLIGGIFIVGTVIILAIPGQRAENLNNVESM